MVNFGCKTETFLNFDTTCADSFLGVSTVLEKKVVQNAVAETIVPNLGPATKLTAR